MLGCKSTPAYLCMAKTTKKDNTKIRIKLNSYDNRIIDLSCSKIIDTAIRTGATVVGPVPLPTKIEKFTVIRVLI